jgi:hypothetical protein
MTGDLLYNLFKLSFSTSPINPISSFLSQREFRASGHTKSGATRFLPVSYASQTPDAYLGLLADDTCIYVADRKEGYVLRTLQRDLSAIETWCERWNTNISSKSGRLLFSKT